jgi:hypothetical protein
MSIQTTLISVSKKYSLTIRNAVQAAILAGLAAVSSQLLSIWQAYADSDTIGGIDWHSLLLAGKRAAVIAGLYLFQQFMSKGKIVIVNPTKATIAAVKDGAPVQVDGETIAVKTPPIAIN